MFKVNRKPNFLIIGAQKAGTSSLFYYLSQHPDIDLPSEKELHFFDIQYENGIEWYSTLFPKKNFLVVRLQERRHLSICFIPSQQSAFTHIIRV
jgi:hypothetical protein